MEKNLKFYRKLPIPKDIKAEYPVSEEIKAKRQKILDEMSDIFEGKSKKLLLIIGPCSADSEEPVMDYLGRLRTLQDEVSDKIMMVPRVYTNKPRTTGEGYKGMLHQPDPNAKPDLLKGIVAIRKIHLRAIEETGFCSADEMLYPENYSYLSCPDCGKDMVIKKTKKGRKYFGCIDYPECNYMVWQRPSGEKCPECGKMLLQKGNKLVCEDEHCGYMKNKEKEV